MELTFTHHQSAHCENGVASNLLKNSGLNISEQMVFGIAYIQINTSWFLAGLQVYPYSLANTMCIPIKTSTMQWLLLHPILVYRS